MEVMDTHNEHLFGFIRQYGDQKLLIINNFSEHPQVISQMSLNRSTLASRFTDRVTDRVIPSGSGLTLAPHQFVWLECS